jgi:hypothetical protein
MTNAPKFPARHLPAFYIAGSTEIFPLNAGERVELVRINVDGTALLGIRSDAGYFPMDVDVADLDAAQAFVVDGATAVQGSRA